MFIPIVPASLTTVVNKTIVYSDTVLPLKDSGYNLKVTSISNVEEYALERCLKKIFESNPNVVFNTIQYSKNDKKVYFYTDSEISIKSWEDSKFITYKPLTSKTEILEELKNILGAEKNKDADCISLYEIAQLMVTKNYQLEKMKDSYESYFKDIINDKYCNTSIRVRDFDYDNNELVIAFKYFKTFDEIRFSKTNGDLFITKSETSKGNDILVALGEGLSKLYDEFNNYKDFEKQFNYGIKSVNSNFLVDISETGVDIFTKSRTFINDFKLFFYSYKSEYSYDCNSNTVIQAFQGKENEVFNRIFVRISDCPKWTQPILLEIRQNQLAEDQRIEDEEKKKEMNKQRRLELVRKLFPFLKN